MAPPFDPSAYACESEAKLRTARPASRARSEPPPADDQGASGVVRSARAAATAISLQSVPMLAVSLGDLRKLKLDHRAGFLLSLVDGSCDVETLLDLAGMTSVDALVLLEEMAAQGILVFR